jgi:dTDP-4-dehydrorhamnose reductase
MADKTVLVTGATGLLGRQVSKVFQKRGNWQVIGTGHSRADGVSILKVDLTVASEVEQALETTKYANI